MPFQARKGRGKAAIPALFPHPFPPCYASWRGTKWRINAKAPPIRRLSRVPPPSPRPSAFPCTYPTPAKSFGTPDFHHNGYTSPLTNSPLAPRRLVFEFSNGEHNP